MIHIRIVMKNKLNFIEYELDYSIENEQICEQIRNEFHSCEEITFVEVAEKYDLPLECVTFHARGVCDCSHETNPVSKKPWAEKELLEELLIEKNIDFKEAGEAFGCHKETVKNWAGEDRFDIMIIDSSERVSSKLVRGPHREGIRRFSDIDKETLIKNAKKVKEESS